MPGIRRLAAAAAVAVLLLTPACAGQPRELTSSAPERPSAAPTPDPVEAAVEGMTIRERAASVVMGHIPTTDVGALRDYMAAGYGGFLLMSANVPATPEQLQEVTAALGADADPPPLIAIDQEGGEVSRLPWDDAPGANALKDQPPEATAQAFTTRAELVSEAGANTNFGIVADIPSDASSFIFSRALGTDPDAVSDRVVAAVGAESGTVRSTLKHFPGHGAAPGDSHDVIPRTGITLDQWRSNDARPFIAGIDAGAELLMFGHLAYTAVDAAPASLSRKWHDIARDELGFEGVMVTDDLGMLAASGEGDYRDPVQNAVSALIAGNDMVLMVMGSTPQTAGEIVDGIVQAVEDGRLPEERLRDAALRVMTLRLQVADSTG